MTKKESNPMPVGAKKPPPPPDPPAKRLINEDKYRGSNKKKKTTIILEDDESALVMNSKGSVNVYFPEMEDGTTIPEYVQFISALATVCTSDLEVIELIWERFHKLVEEVG